MTDQSEWYERFVVSYDPVERVIVATEKVDYGASRIIARDVDDWFGKAVVGMGNVPPMRFHDHRVSKCSYPCNIIAGTVELVRDA